MNFARFGAMLATNFKLCWIEIGSNKLRSLISTTGIFLGTASLLVNMTFIRGMKSDIEREMQRMGGLSLVTVREVRPEDQQQALSFARSPGLLYSQLAQLQQTVGGIKSLLPQEDLHWLPLRARGKSEFSRVSAVSAAHHEPYNYTFIAGTGFSPQQEARRERVCVIGQTVAQELFDTPQGAIGERVVLRGSPFLVVGVLEGRDKFDRRGMETHIPFSTWQVSFASNPDRIDEVGIELASTDSLKQQSLHIEEALRGMHRGVQDFELEINQEKLKEMETASAGIRILIGAIAIISLSVGAVSIANTMFGTIGDRIREIGIRKALGARRSDLFMQFLIEASMLALVGGLPGLAVGGLFSLIPAGVFPFTPELASADYVSATLFVLLAGVGSGLFPALKASAMKPIEALTY
jgi:putative ABC transport system permease protein